MDKIIINIHSMVDIITNSSTELFVLDTEKSVEVVKEILEEAIRLHNTANNVNLKFDDVFQELYFGNAKNELDDWGYTTNLKEGIVIRSATDNAIPYWMFEFIESIFGYSTERFHLG